MYQEAKICLFLCTVVPGWGFWSKSRLPTGLKESSTAPEGERKSSLKTNRLLIYKYVLRTYSTWGMMQGSAQREEKQGLSPALKELRDDEARGHRTNRRSSRPKRGASVSWGVRREVRKHSEEGNLEKSVWGGGLFEMCSWTLMIWTERRRKEEEAARPGAEEEDSRGPGSWCGH